VADMNQVTQQNAANAEELASVMSMFRVESAQKAAANGSGKRGRAIEAPCDPVEFTSPDPETVIPMQGSKPF